MTEPIEPTQQDQADIDKLLNEDPAPDNIQPANPDEETDQPPAVESQTDPAFTEQPHDDSGDAIIIEFSDQESQAQRDLIAEEQAKLAEEGNVNPKPTEIPAPRYDVYDEDGTVIYTGTDFGVILDFIGDYRNDDSVTTIRRVPGA